jgi:hypothetical protein
MVPVQFTPLENQYFVDFAQDSQLHPQIDQAQVQASIQAWLVKCQAAIDAGYLESPGYNWPKNPSGELKDLLLPFGQYLAKHPEVSLAVPFIARLFYITHDLMGTPTLFVMGDSGPQAFGVMLSNNEYFVLVAGQDPESGGPIPLGNQVLYDLITADLAQSGKATLLLSSTVKSKSTCRNDGRVQIVAKGQDGTETPIIAKQLLVAIPPVKEHLEAFMDLDQIETSLFSDWQYSSQWTTMIDNPGFSQPWTVSVSNMATPSQTNPFGLPGNPYVPGLIPYLTSGKFIAYAISDKSLTQAEVEALVTDAVDSTEAALGSEMTPTDWTFVGPPADHSPANLFVRQDVLASGFIKKIINLQGHKQTYYTGKGWTGDYSPLVWEHAKSIVEMMK